MKFWTNQDTLAKLIKDLQDIDTFDTKLIITNHSGSSAMVKLTRKQVRRLGQSVSILDRYSRP